MSHQDLVPQIQAILLQPSPFELFSVHRFPPVATSQLSSENIKTLELTPELLYINMPNQQITLSRVGSFEVDVKVDPKCTCELDIQTVAKDA